MLFASIQVIVGEAFILFPSCLAFLWRCSQELVSMPGNTCSIVLRELLPCILWLQSKDQPVSVISILLDSLLYLKPDFQSSEEFFILVILIFLFLDVFSRTLPSSCLGPLMDQVFVMLLLKFKKNSFFCMSVSLLPLK